MEKTFNVLENLQKYIIQEDYKGYDPFDILNSPIFKLPFLKSNKFIRFNSQQLFRRIPFNIRPLLGIKKEENPVTLGLCIQTYGYLSVIIKGEDQFYINEINKLINRLLELSSDNYSGYCWGYNFDWEGRYANIPKYMPTIVATGIITNALYEYYTLTKDDRIPSILISAANFVMNDLNRIYEENSYCLSYSPNDRQKVYNASIKGSRLLSQVYYLTKDTKYLTEVNDTVRFVVKNQQPSGSWSYSKDDARTWTDNFHTAYVLDALDEIIRNTHIKEYSKHLEIGVQYYVNNLFTDEGLPKYYSHSVYPIDSTELAQSIITLLRFSYLEKARKCFEFAIKYLYSGRGYFYYQKKKMVTDRNLYMRWSMVWFFVAITKILYALKENS